MTDQQIRVKAPDNPRGTVYALAPVPIQLACDARFEGFGRFSTVKHPTEPDVFIYGPENFWDGPRHIRQLPNGNLEFDLVYASDADVEEFDLNGDTRVRRWRA